MAIQNGPSSLPREESRLQAADPQALMPMQNFAGVHVDLDGAWPSDALPSKIDLREWGPKLRFCALQREIAEFREIAAAKLGDAAFILYGSGDFHHLSALWAARVSRPFTLVCFDNHPDWDIRPPKWCCGSWQNRALDLPQVERISIWGCGNFECWGMNRWWGNHRDVRSGRLAAHAWADERSEADRALPQAILTETWRDRFLKFADTVRNKDLYVTVDFDCLREGDVVTNWENGRFSVEDVGWALEELRARAQIIAGDACGAYSPQGYARWKQCFAANTDHPDLPAPADSEQARIVNTRALASIWPRLTGS